MIFDCVVIGKGLVGASALKYLSKNLENVIAIGPSEPANFKEHNGVFASHYDSGRITRILDGDRSCFWAKVAQKSISRYAEIENESGVSFFKAVGCLKVAPNNKDGQEYIESHKYVASKTDVNYKELSISELSKKFPYLNFHEDSSCLMEEKTAGWINPRKLIEAQLNIAKANNAHILNETVCNVTRVNGEDSVFHIETDSKSNIQAKKVLVAAGAFSNFNNLLLQKLDMTIRGESIALAEISDETANTLSSMPSIIWPIQRGDILSHIYIVPVVRYPDGKNYIKVGAKSKKPLRFNDLAHVNDWFHTDGRDEFNQELVNTMTELMPSTEFLSWQFKPCIITDTEDEKPIIEAVEKNLFVATGGNGYGAKSSDELGRLAQKLCLNS